MYQINHPVEPQGEEKRYPSINTPLLTFYAVPEIALPACEEMKDGKSLVIVGFQSFLIHGKHFKCSANTYLIHPEKLNITSSEKVSVLTFKCEKNIILI